MRNIASTNQSQENLVKPTARFAVQATFNTKRAVCPEDKGRIKYFTKVVALSMQMLDRKPNEEPMMTVEEETAEYEAEPA